MEILQAQQTGKCGKAERDGQKSNQPKKRRFGRSGGRKTAGGASSLLSLFLKGQLDAALCQSQQGGALFQSVTLTGTSGNSRWETSSCELHKGELLVETGDLDLCQRIQEMFKRRPSSSVGYFFSFPFGFVGNSS